MDKSATISPQRDVFDRVMLPNYAPAAMIPVRGKGARLWDQQENEYIDFAGGIAVSCLGHCHPNLVRALTEQGQKLWHLSNVLTNEPALRLAEKLVKATFADKVYFCNSGAEANEAALKLARRYALEHFGEHKDQIIAFKQGFHGRTFFTVTVGGQPIYSDGFGPKPGGVEHVTYNDLEEFEALISDHTCAVMMEPLQGEGGIISPDPEFVKGVRELCDRHNALLIFDEVQSGAGRTGALYAYMNLGVVPDILTSAKGLGGGFPIGAMLTTDKVAPSLKIGTHGSTYGGNPLACAVSEAAFDTINDPEILAGVRERETWFKDALAELNSRYELFEDIRGQGLLLGAELKSEFKGQAKQLLTLAAKHGLFVLVAGPNIIRFTPSLILTREEFDTGMARLDKAMAEFAAEQK